MNGAAKHELAKQLAHEVLAEREACAKLAEDIKVDPDCSGRHLLDEYHLIVEATGDPKEAIARICDLIVEFTGAAIAEQIRAGRRP